MIRSNRDRGVTFHTTPDTLEALEAEAGKLGVSRSKLVHDVLVLEMRRRGHAVRALEWVDAEEVAQ